MTTHAHYRVPAAGARPSGDDDDAGGVGGGRLSAEVEDWLSLDLDVDQGAGAGTARGGDRAAAGAGRGKGGSLPLSMDEVLGSLGVPAAGADAGLPRAGAPRSGGAREREGNDDWRSLLDAEGVDLDAARVETAGVGAQDVGSDGGYSS